MCHKSEKKPVPLWEPFPRDIPGFSLSVYVSPCREIPGLGRASNRLLLDSLFLLFPELGQPPIHPFLDPWSVPVRGLDNAANLMLGDQIPTFEDFNFLGYNLHSADPALLEELRSLPPEIYRIVFFLIFFRNYWKVSFAGSYVMIFRFFLYAWFIWPLFERLFAPSGYFGFFRLRVPVYSLLVPFFWSGQGSGVAIFGQPQFASLLSSSFPRLVEYLAFTEEEETQFPPHLVDVLFRAVSGCMLSWPSVSEEGDTVFSSFPLERIHFDELLQQPCLLPARCGFRAETEHMDAFFDRVCLADERPPTSFDPVAIPYLRRLFDSPLEELFLLRYVDYLAYLGRSFMGSTSSYSFEDVSELRFRFPPGFLDPFSRSR